MAENSSMTGRPEEARQMQIDRISYMEGLLREASEVMAALEDARDQLEASEEQAERARGRLAEAEARLTAAEPGIRELDKYYGSGDWRRDYETDEAGLLPADLRRGVLSQDELFNLLAEYDEHRRTRGGIDAFSAATGEGAASGNGAEVPSFLPFLYDPQNPGLRRPASPIPAEAFAPGDDTRVYWLAGAGFLIHSRGTNILLDPVLTLDAEDPTKSEAGLPLKVKLPLLAAEVPVPGREQGAEYASPEEGVPGSVTVLYTHADRDHLGPETAKILAAKGIRMVGTPMVFEKLVRLGVPAEQIEVLRVAERTQIGGIGVEATIADHPWQLKDLKRGGRPFRIGDCCGFILTVPEGRLFFPGDTRLMEDHLRIEDIDLLALDVSTDEFHIGHTCGPVLANQFPEAAILPFHYGTYDCPDIAAHVGEPEEVYPRIHDVERRGFILAPGEAFSVTEYVKGKRR